MAGSLLALGLRAWRGASRMDAPAGDRVDPHARAREHRLAVSVLAAYGARGLSLLTALVSVPLTVGYLGTERFGLWMTISAFTAFFGFADLGVGNGLLNAIAAANGRGDRVAAQRSVSSAAALMIGLSLALALLLAAVYPLIPWASWLNVSSSQAAAEAGPAVAIFIACFLVNLPLGIVDKVQLGYQEGFVNSLWTAGGNLLGLAGVLLVIALHAALPWLVLAVAGAPALARLLNGLVLFAWRKPWLRPRLVWSTRAGAVGLLRVGLLFFLLQSAVAVAFQSDNLVLARLIGPRAVAQYSVSFRLFNLVPMLLSLGLITLWPAYGEAIARNDLAWVKRTLARSLKLALLATVPASIILVAAGGEIVALWAGHGLRPSFPLLLGLGAWMVIGTVGNMLAVLLNAAGVLRFQVVAAVAMASVNLGLSIVLTQAWGVSGVIWGTVLSYGLISLAPTAWRVARLLSNGVPANLEPGSLAVREAA